MQQIDQETIEDPFKSPEAVETFNQIRARMQQQAEAQQNQIKTKEDRIARELTIVITSLQKFMAPEDVAAHAYDFAMQAYCELWQASRDFIPTKVRLKAAQVLEQVYHEIGKAEGRQGMLMLLQAEIDKARMMELQWSDEDEVYIVTVPSLPGCKTHGKTLEEAVQQGKEAIESWISASKTWGDAIPSSKETVNAEG